MEALEIEGQTDQTPLACRRRDPTQGELAEAEDLFDDADHRFDRAFACPVDRFAQRGSQLVGHLDLCARVLRRRVSQGREALLPTRMMGITARGDVGLNAGGHPKSCVKTQNGVLALYDQVRYGIEYTRGKLQRAQAW